MTMAGLSEEAALRDIQDLLVAEAEKLILGLRGGDYDIGKRQLSCAIDVAGTADTLRVFVNWLRYQVSREQSRDFWARTTHNDTNLAEAVVQSLGLIRNELSKRCGKVSEETIMRAATFFLGYLRRAFVGREFLSSVAIS